MPLVLKGLQIWNLQIHPQKATLVVLSALWIANLEDTNHLRKLRKRRIGMPAAVLLLKHAYSSLLFILNSLIFIQYATFDAFKLLTMHCTSTSDMEVIFLKLYCIALIRPLLAQHTCIGQSPAHSAKHKITRAHKFGRATNIPHFKVVQTHSWSIGASILWCVELHFQTNRWLTRQTSCGAQCTIAINSHNDPLVYLMDLFWFLQETHLPLNGHLLGF